jgi:hypothetical protein
MLSEEPVDTRDFGAARKIVERGIAFAKGDDFFEVVDDGKKIAEAPDAGLVHCQAGRPALLPEPAEGAGIGEETVGIGGGARCSGRLDVGFDIRPWVGDFVEAVAPRAAKVAADLVLCDDGGAFCASKVVCRYIHGFL